MQKKMIAMLLLCCMVLGAAPGCAPKTEEPSSAEPSRPSAQEEENFRQVVTDAYLYALPLILHDTLRGYLTNTEKPTSNRAPQNTFFHFRKPLIKGTKGLLRANADALQSQAVLDLTVEPDVLTVPSGEEFTLSFYDSWGERVLVLDRPGNYILRGPTCEGSYASHQAEEILLPDNRIICTVQILCDANEHADLERAKAWQDQLKLFAFSASSTEPPTGIYDPEKRFDPKKTLLQMNTTAFFRRYNELAAIVGDRHIPMKLKENMAKYGIGAGLIFRPDEFNFAERLFLETLPLTVFDELAVWEKENQREQIGWWADEQLESADDIQRRALNALHRCYPADPHQMLTVLAWTDGLGNPLTGGEYELVLTKDMLPGDAIWSVGVYTRNGEPIYTDGRCSYLSTALKPDENGTYRIRISRTQSGNGALCVGEEEFTVLYRVYHYDGTVRDLVCPSIYKEIMPGLPHQGTEQLPN